MFKSLALLGLGLLAATPAGAQCDCCAQCPQAPSPIMQFATFETKVTMDTSVTVSTQVGSATVEVERLRRIGMTTTDTGDPLLFAISEVAGLPPLGGQPFGADTRFGTIRGQLGRGRFVMVVAHIEVPPAVASPVADTSKWACYAIDGAPGGRFEMHWTDA